MGIGKVGGGGKPPPYMISVIVGCSLGGQDTIDGQHHRQSQDLLLGIGDSQFGSGQAKAAARFWVTAAQRLAAMASKVG